MKSCNFIANAALTVCLLTSHNATAFGAIGHRVVGEIAEQRLDADVKQKVMTITQGKSLAQISTWADEIRSDENWNHASPWHYVSIADDESWADVSRNPKGDIIASLERFEKVLKNTKSTPLLKSQALAFYVHFVGDIHQPLHVGHAHDHGGNKVKLNWFGKPTNLHSVWDSKIIEHQKLSYTEMTQFISHFTQSDIKSWQGKNYYEWADESKALRESAYQFDRNQDGDINLGFKYIFNHNATVELRLQQAGVRLAEKLNAIFAK